MKQNGVILKTICLNRLKNNNNYKTDNPYLTDITHLDFIYLKQIFECPERNICQIISQMIGSQNVQIKYKYLKNIPQRLNYLQAQRHGMGFMEKSNNLKGLYPSRSNLNRVTNMKHNPHRRSKFGISSKNLKIGTKKAGN